MKKLYSAKSNNLKSILQLVLVMVLALSPTLFTYGQVKVPFTPRSSVFTPGKTIYNVKGDFTMIGNTNLTLVNYTDDGNNADDMKYVDVDNDPNTLNSSSATLTFSDEFGATPECSNIVYAGLYWSGRAGAENTFTVSKDVVINNQVVPVTKTFDKRKVSIKGPSATSYTQLTANATDIYYPSGVDDNMYSAYVDVTDYVKNNGQSGVYHVADMALVEGDGDDIGYFGGWGMVVVYENSQMKWRDITVFDGHAYIKGHATLNHTLDVAGFNSTQSGPVNLRLGIMAGEGDRSIGGDYFKIQKQSDNSYQPLRHDGNSMTNFFNSTIRTEGVRNPNLLNNTGLDITMFDLDNFNNSIIGNNQTSTRFQYGSTQDSYIIFNITFAVDAYIPESEGLLSIHNIAGNPVNAPYVALPGDEIEYGLEIRNKGTEAIQNAKLVIPIPFTSEFVPGSISFNEYDNLFNATAPYFDPNEGATGSIVWDIAYLPLDTDLTKLLADIRFRLKTTEDCTILVNSNCSTKVVILGGYISGTGATSGIDYSLPLIQGYQQNGVCEGEPNTDPLTVDINSEQFILDNCSDVTAERAFYYCNVESSTIPVSEVQAQFPQGSLFYDSYPITGSTIQYNASNPFPATPGISTYYAIPPGSSACNYIFTIEVTEITTSPSVTDATYCLNETAGALSAQVTNPDYLLLYYTDNDPNTIGQTSLVPDTSVVGEFTYYVSEGPATNCVGPRTPITVSVYNALTITLVDQINNSCATTNNGSIDISVEGGSGNYIYKWEVDGVAGPTTEDLTNLPDGTYTVTVSEADTNTCTAAATFIITTENTGAVEINAPADISVSGCTTGDITNGGLTSLPYSEAIVTISNAEFLAEGGTFVGDNISSVTYSDASTGTCPLVVTRTYTVTDGCDQTDTSTQIITIDIDLQANFIVPQNQTVECGNSTDPTSTGTGLVSLACGTVDISYTDVSVAECGNTETITRTWTATDACGNVATGIQTITVVDTTPPVLSMPDDVTMECIGYARGPEDLIGEATAVDGCGRVSLTFEDVAVQGCGNTQVISRTWTAMDECGNTVSDVQTITIIDTTPPTLTLPADITIECNGSTDPSATGTATAIDNCGDVTVTYTDSSTGEEGAQIITRTWIATDACGNTAEGTQTITVIDTVAPILTVPADVSVECSTSTEPSATGNASATDACTTTTLTFTDNSVEGCGNTEVITRTWIATDAAGNTASGDQIITVVDTTPPVLTLPADVTMECTGLARGTGDPFGEATATDACGNVSITFEDTAAAGCGVSQVISRTWTATDECGNSVSGVQTISIVDITPPSITVPADITIECSDSTDPSVTGNASASDECGDVNLTFNDVVVDGSCDNMKTITRTWTAIDECGNTATEIQTISVVDTTAPVIDTPASDITIDCDINNNTLQAWLNSNGGATATDNCSTNLIWTNNYSGSTTDCSSSIEVIFTVDDGCGNTTSTLATYTIQDVTAPEIITQATNLTVECDGSGNTNELQNWVDGNAGASAVDECSSVTWSNDFNGLSDDCGATGSATVTFTATDGCGNSSSTTAVFTIVDTAGPIISPLPAETTIDCNETPEFAQVTATDTCSSDVTLTFEDVTTDGTCVGDYTVTRTWTATDACGNVSTASQIIHVKDITAPNLVNEYDAEIAITCDNIPSVPELVFEDACSEDIQVEFNETSTATEGSLQYVITRTWTVSDICENQAVYTQTITVDNTVNIIVATGTELCNDDNLNFDLFDLLSGSYDTNGTWSVVAGTASLNGSIFNPYKLDLGTYTFMYAIADEYCPSETLVNITLNDDCVVLPCGAEDVIISKAVTTYADGKNDFFTITGVENCGFTVELQIFNRWGAMIYESHNYQNDWNGAASKASIGNSNFVPTGTYYYVVNLKNSGLKPFAGPIYVATK
ncbi:HYR-like domain-containing protein [Gelidibacter gilvus]|uniref:Gliding motility-associated C-terminal domain-containing protein n=1 Tax=Gelidibacter gilvus TaxID=59602 RepID=A0A4Q0XJM1_9FLAO|nr:gliding motility-associated C-terminal domain-containing protein [Gelidibacter gilvus]RXJ51353.1 hypothetical protein ESZ48_05660 [Gelidibacter gilvus]